MQRRLLWCLAVLLGLVIGIMPVIPANAGETDKTIHVAVIGDSISEYKGDCFHSDNYCNYGEDGRGSVTSKDQMWYRMMASFLNEGENGKYHTSWQYEITCVDALGGSMVYNDNSTGENHTLYHRGGCCIAGSMETVSGINVDYYGESRLGCLDSGVENHPKAIDLILIQMGTNDAVHKVGYDDEYNAYIDLLKRVHDAYPHAAIVSILPSTTLSVFPNATWQEVRNAITSAVNSGAVPVSALVDPSEAFGYTYAESDGVTKGIHPTDEGQKYLGDIVANAIQGITYETVDIHEESVDYIVDIQPTCTGSGSKSKHCTICGESIPETIISVEALGHDYQNYKSDGNETCTKDGTKTGTCTRCGGKDTIENTGSKKGHEYTDIITPAACLTKGYTTHVCVNCNDTYVSDYTNALGHTKGTPVKENILESTCETSGGYVMNTYCTRCNQKIDSAAYEIQPLGHDFIARSRTESSCIKAGVIHYQCSRCNKEQDVAIDLANHQAADGFTVDIQPSCTMNGSKSRHCEVCNAIIVSTVAEIPALGHDFKLRSEVNATCVTDGKEEYQCVRCQIGYEKILPALGHDYTEDVIAPTCEDKGYTLHVCQRCGGKEQDTYVAPLGHTKKNPIVEHKVEPTCIKEGGYCLSTYCATCNKLLEEKSITEAALGHAPTGSMVKNEIPGSCVNDHVYDLVTYCMRCGVELKKEHITEKAPGHDYEFLRLVDSTCTQEGSKLYRCKICQSEKYETVSATGHIPSSVFIVDEQPSCEKTGRQSKHCTVCNAIITDTVQEIPATGHSYKDHILQEASCEKNGVIASICEKCGDTQKKDIEKQEHDYYKTVVKATKYQQGYTIYKCKKCGYSYKDDYTEKVTSVYAPAASTKSGKSGSERADVQDPDSQIGRNAGSSTYHERGEREQKDNWQPALSKTSETGDGDKKTASDTGKEVSRSTVPLTVVKEDATEREIGKQNNTAEKEVVPVQNMSNQENPGSEAKGADLPETEKKRNDSMDKDHGQQETSLQDIKEVQQKKKMFLFLVPVILVSLGLIAGAVYLIVQIVKKKERSAELQEDQNQQSSLEEEKSISG